MVIERSTRTGLVPLVVIGFAVAALVAVAMSALSGNPPAGLLIVRVLTETGAVVTIGSLLLAAFLVPPQPSGMLAADGYAAMRTAGWFALVWLVGAVLSVPFTTAAAIDRPVSSFTFSQMIADGDAARAVEGVGADGDSSSR